MDGEIDYSGKTLRELRQSEASINAELYPKNFANLQEAIRQRLLNDPDTNESPELEHRPQIWASAADGRDKVLLPYKEVAKYAAIFLAVSLALAITITSILQQFDIPAGRWLRIIYFTAGGMLVGRIFVSRHRRLFFEDEAMQVMSACFGAIIFFELVGALLILPLLFDMPTFSSMSILMTVLGMVILLTLDGVMMYVAFRFPVRGLMLYSARKMENLPKDM